MPIKHTELSPIPRVYSRAYLSANQEDLVSGVDTKIELDAETFDPDGLFDPVTNHRFTSPISGYYQVNSQIHFTNAVAAKTYYLRIYRGGVSRVASRVYSGTTYATVQLSTLIYIAVTDFVELYGQSVAGVNTVDVYGNTGWTFMEVFLAKVL